MYVAAYAVSASILGVAGDKVVGISPIWALLIGVGGAGVPVGLAAWFGRKKTDVDVSKEITNAAAELLRQYRQRDLELEARLVKAELAATTALLSESECRRRLTALEQRVTSLHPTGEITPGDSTTTTTVQVTHQ